MSNQRLLLLSALIIGNVEAAFAYRAWMQADVRPNTFEAAVVISQALFLSLLVCCGPGLLWQRFALACAGLYGIRLANWSDEASDFPWLSVTLVATLWFTALRAVGFRLVHRDDSEIEQLRQYSIGNAVHLTTIVSVYLALLVAEPSSPWTGYQFRLSLIQPFDEVATTYALLCVPPLAVALLACRMTLLPCVAALLISLLANLVAGWEVADFAKNLYSEMGPPSLYEALAVWWEFSVWKYHLLLTPPLVLNLLALRWFGWRLDWPRSRRRRSLTANTR